MSRSGNQPRGGKGGGLDAILARYRAQDFAAVTRLCRQGLRQDPHHAGLHHLLGVALIRRGDDAGGLEHLRRAVALEPENAEFLTVLGHALTDAEQVDEALAVFRQAIALEPRNATIRVRLAQLLRRFGQPGQAMQQLDAALKAEPRHVEALVTAGEVFMELGMIDKGLKSFDLALASDPDHIVGLSNRAYLLECGGRREEAIAGYHAVLVREPDNIFAHGRLAGLEPASDDDPRLELLEKRSRGRNLPSTEAALLHLTLGKLYESAGRFDASFAHYVAANQHRSKIRGNDFSLDEFIDEVDALCEGFTADYFAAVDAPRDPAEQPVFVIGMPRSGTTLVESIIDAHGQAAGAGELPHLRAIQRQILPDLADRPATRLREIDPALLAKAAQQYLALLRRGREGARRVVDKMPHNFMFAFLIPLLFANARIVHCVRDPRDTCLSCFVTDFAQGHGYRNDLANLGRYYRHYERLMAHWHEVLPTPMLTVRYEELVADPQAGGRRLIEFLGLAWEPGCLEFPVAQRMVRTASTSQVREGVYQSSAGRWRRFEAQLQPLLEALGDRS